MIASRYAPPTSCYGSHMGTCHHFPARAEAWLQKDGKTTAHIEITSDQFPNLEPEQLTAKAVAMLRSSTKQ